MSEKPIKLACYGSTKRNVYVLPSKHYYEMRNRIIEYLFSNGEAINPDFRVYWIDQDNDEIDVVNQSDYEIFLNACKDRLQLYAVKKGQNASKNNPESSPKAQTDGMFPTTSVHTHVEFNNCMLKPLVGFRYKCVECHDYDLCQSCEAKHVHAEHMMVRMPNADCPNLIEAWVTGRSKRCHKRAGRSSCPFVATAPEMPSSSAPGGGDSERHHRRSHRKRDFNNGVFGHLYKIMVDLAEGGVQVNDEANANAANAATEAAKAAAAESAAAAANAAVNVAARAASTAASAASTAAKMAAEATANSAAQETKAEQTTNTGAKPKSPPSTPRAASGNNSEPNSIPMTPSLENLSQYIDPHYMRTGIEILNNFSEMFAKMLDPEDGVGLEVASNAEARKSSAASTTSSNSKATSTNVEQSNAASQATVEKENENEAPTSTTESPRTSVVAESPEQRRSQSIDDNDWQMIDQQAAAPEIAGAEAPAAKPIDFAQLSKDLKAHIEDEQKRQEEQKQSQTTMTQITGAAAEVPIVAAATEVAALAFPAPQSAPQPAAPSAPQSAPQPAAPSAPQSAPQPAAPPKPSDENRGVLYYHPNPRINNATHAMIAMGFSNDGNWLTQLLESVNGSIPDALDLMNAAQRNNN